MRAGTDHRHHNHMDRKDVEHRQRTDHIVFFCKQQRVTDPAVVNHPRIAMLRHFWHARGAARVEVSRHAVTFAISKIKRRALCADRGIPLVHFGIVGDRVFGADQRDDHLLDAGHIPQQINLNHVLNIRRKCYRFGSFLCHVSLWESLQRDNNFGLCLTQNGPDLCGVQKRVHRVHDARDHTANYCRRCLITVGQHKCHRIFFTNTKTAEQVGGLNAARKKLIPGQRLGCIFRTRENLIRNRRA